MNRKDCEQSKTTTRARGSVGAPRGTAFFLVVALLWGISGARAGEVRLWPRAVVVGERILLRDVAEWRGLDSETERSIAPLALTDSPKPGESRTIAIQEVRSLLSQNGVNPTTCAVIGALQCVVTRPADLRMQPTQEQENVAGATHSRRERNGSAKRAGFEDANANRSKRELDSSTFETSMNQDSLRKSVVAFFDAELARFGGRADVAFDRSSDAALELRGPEFTFQIRRRTNNREMLGLISLEVDLQSEGKTVRVLPLVVQVSLVRPTVVARRSINQGATIDPTDVQVISMTFTRVDRFGIDDVSQAIGQRAKKFIPAGTLIESDLLESVPLVVRGQTVTLTSTVNGIHIVTAAKAAGDGLLGARVRVQTLDQHREEFDAVVVGPARVAVGADPGERRSARLADGRRP